MSSCERRDAIDDAHISKQLEHVGAEFSMLYLDVIGICCKSSSNLCGKIQGFQVPGWGKKHHAQDAMDKMRFWFKAMGFMASLQVRLRLAEVPGGVFLYTSTILFGLRDCAAHL